MTETIGPSIAALHSTEPKHCIVLATRGQQTPDWPICKAKYCERLAFILDSWKSDAEEVDTASYIEQLSTFEAPPHTVQRLTELLDDPQQWYTSLPKYCRALDRVLSVTFTTIDYAVQKEEYESLHHDSPLVPIPWLTQDSMTGGEDVANGYTQSGTLSEAVKEHGTAATGIAPMDAADYGPQSEDVHEAIAQAGAPGQIDQANGQTTQNGHADP